MAFSSLVPRHFWIGSHVSVPSDFIPFRLQCHWLHSRTAYPIRECNRALEDSNDIHFQFHSKQLIMDVLNSTSIGLNQSVVGKKEARDCLTVCLQSLVVFDRKGMTTDLTCVFELLMKRSVLSFELNDPTTALNDLKLAKLLNPSRPEIWLESCKIQMASESWLTAFREMISLLSNQNIRWDDGHKWFISAAVCMTRALAKLSASALKEIPKGVTLYWVEGINLWRLIVMMFCDRDEYDGMGILTIGTCDNLLQADIPNIPIVKAANVSGIKFPDINIGKILFKLNAKGIKRWHLKMGEFFIQRDADIHTIASEFKMPLIVAMVMLSLHADTPSFLDMAWSKMPVDKLDQKDVDYGTAYHYLARQVACADNLRIVSTAEMLCNHLLSHGCLACLKDNEGRLPFELLPPNKRLHGILFEAIEYPSDGLRKRLKSLTDMADDLKKESGALLDYEENDSLDHAIALYDSIVSIKTLYKTSFGVELAKSHLKLAIAYFKKGSLDKCHASAVASYRIETEFDEISPKTCYWKALSKEKMGKAGEAFMEYLEAFTHQRTKKDQLFMLREGLKLLPIMSGQDNSFILSFGVFEEIWENPSNWERIVEVVNTKKMWEVLKIFYLGPPCMPGSGHRGLLWEKPANQISLHTVWDVLDDYSVQAPRLVLALIQRGGDYRKLSSDPSEGLHAVVRFCALTNDTAVLRHVLGNQKTSSISVNGTDSNNRTPLHTLCLLKNKKVTDDTLLKLAKILCDAGYDVSLKDDESKMAVDYATDKLKDWLKTGKAQPAVPSKQGATPTPAPDTWQSLKEAGNREYEKKKFGNALDLYSQAMKMVDKGKRKGSSHNKALILGNMTECYMKMDKWNEAILTGIKCRDMDPKWFKAYWRLGRILQHAEEDDCFFHMLDETAFGLYMDALMNVPKDDNEEKNMITILLDMLSRDPQVHEFFLLREFISCDVVATLIHHYIVKENDWEKASLVHKLYNGSTAKKHVYDLSFLCKKDKIKEHSKMVIESVFIYVQAGSDVSTLKFHPGDYYIHALITIMVTVPEHSEFEQTCMELFVAVLSKTQRMWRERHKACDDKGNTPLHHVALLKGNSRVRHFVCKLLLREKFDIFQLNKDNQRAPDLCLKSDPLWVYLGGFQEEVKKHSSKTQQGWSSRNQKQECDDCEDLMKRALNLQTQRKYPQMYLNLVTVINEKGHDNDARHSKFRKTCVTRIADTLGSSEQPEIPSHLTNLCEDGLLDVIRILIKKKKWTQMQQLTTSVKASKSHHFSLDFLHKNLPVDQVISDREMCAKEIDRCKLVQFLIDNGAKITPSMSADLLKQAMQANEFKIVLLLLNNGADPKSVTLTLGDTPLHAALRIALLKDIGNFSVFDWLTSKNRKGSDKVDWDVRDKLGNNLLHLAAKAQSTHASMMAVERLCKNRVPVTVKNKDGKLPRDLLLSQSDRRAEFLRPKASQTSSTTAKPAKSNQVKGQTASATAAEGTKPDSTRTDLSPSPEKEAPKPKVPAEKVFSVRQCRKEMKTVLSSLPEVIVDLFPPSIQDLDLEGYNEDEEEEEEDEEKEESDREEDKTMPSLDINWSEGEEEAEAVTSKNTDRKGKLDAVAYNGDGDGDGINFDDLPWEVECTEEVWNFLKNQRMTKRQRKRKEEISDSLKMEIVGKIQQLAQGDWSMAKAIDLDEEDSARLYRVGLTRGFIVLEIAVAFSSKLKDAAESKTSPSPGPVYSEIIRVWNVVSTQSEARQTLHKIILSHRRGKECYVKETLDRKEYSLQRRDDLSSSNLRYPFHYAEAQVSDRTLGPENSGHDEKGLTLCPPASTGKMEFHILKFYSLSSTLVSAVFNKMDLKVDFPFKVTPLEHKIISLPCGSPVLLLGRSGTGKTTICVYRLWKKFLEYWEKERHQGQPLLAREVPAIEGGGEEEEACAPPADRRNSHHQDGEKKKKECENNTAADVTNNDQELVCENAWMEPIDDGDDDDDDDDSNGADDGYDDRLVNDGGDGGARDKGRKTSEESGSEGDGGDAKLKRQVEYHHLHQVFVTKNPQLCSEVGKTFQRLRNSVHFLTDHGQFDDRALPNTLQDVQEHAFPLFVTSRQLLLLLDASLDGKPFFERDENLALKVNIPGWGTQEEIFHNIPLEGSSDEDFDDDFDDEGDRGAGTGRDAKGHRRRQVHDFRAGGAVPKRQNDKKRECTYEVFAHEVWAKIAHKKVNEFHPSLVWTEIMSIIKGSYEALQTKSGFLSKEKYQEVGQKRAPNFSGDRDDVYTIFKQYLKYKREKRLFDESDLVFNIYTRLREMPFCQWVFDEIYVDELQDFTQAELTLLIALSHEPNRMFLTGDTAQSIMHGISFRFKDLKSLFFFAKQSQTKRDKGLRAIKPPGGVHPLRYNYRSHSGILSLASSVLDLLTKFFPESYDVLDRDQGLFDGPNPVLIESCSQTDLALLLSGNQRQTSHIEFGAHQAILVTNQQAKENIPADLKTGIVLTIYESKGLEFDDILLYNFFKDSQASKTNEWRVVTDFLKELVDRKKTDGTIEELDTEILRKPGRPHPLTFNPVQHKILNTELKHLYTALTRARVNVWIFDEDQAKSAPVFEYFRALKLVKAVGLGDKEKSFGDQLFTKKSTSKEWYSKAEMFMKRKLYEPAAKCYSMAQDPKMEKFATAYHLAHKATTQQKQTAQQTALHMEAASLFVKCDRLHAAATCFLRAKENKLAAVASEKNGEMKRAADQYKRVLQFVDASRCYERGGMFDSAISVLVDSKEFERALDCLHRYHNMIKECQFENKAVPQVVVDHRPRDSHSEKHLLYMLAEDYLSRDEEEMMFNTIDRLDECEDQFHFLTDKGYNERAARILDKMGRTEDAAKLMLEENFFQDALEYARKGKHVLMEASIHLTMAQIQLSPPEESTLPSDMEDDMLKAPDTLHQCEKNARRALDLFQELAEDNGKGQATLVLGCLKKSKDLLNKAHHIFQNVKPPNVAGQIEAFQETFALSPFKTFDLMECKKGLEMIRKGTQVIKILRNPTKEEEDRHLAYLTFYGLEFIPGSDMVTWNPNHFPVSRKRLTSLSLQEVEDSGKIHKEKSEIVDEIWDSLVADLTSWAGTVGDSLGKLSKGGCDYQSDGHALNYLESLCLRVELNELEQTIMSYFNPDPLGEVKSVLPLLDFLPPANQRMCLFDSKLTLKMLKRVRTSDTVKNQLSRYLLYKWDHPDRVARGKSTDVTKERAKESDWLIQACLFESLFGLDIHTEKKANDLEMEIMRLGKEWAKKSHKYAIFVLYHKKSQQITAVESLGGRFIKSFKELVGTRQSPPDPYEAIFKFTKLIAVFGSRGEPGIMPAPEHLLFWLEFYVSLTFCFIGKSFQEQDSHFYLPASYFHHFDVVNACRGSHPGSLLTDVVKHKSYLYTLGKRIRERQDFLINFLVGNPRFSKFSLMDHVPAFFKSDDAKDLVAGERIIVLALVLLLNTGRGFVQMEYRTRLHKSLFFGGDVTATMPQALANLISTIPTVNNYSHLLHLIRVFLQERRREPLMHCFWQDQMAPPLQKKSLTHAEMDKSPDSSEAQDFDTANSALEDEEEEGVDVEEFEELDEMERYEMEKQAQERQLQLDREMKAAKTIVNYLRRCVLKSQQELEKNPYKIFEERYLFAPYALFVHRCGICGVDLASGGGAEDGRDTEGQTREVHEMTDRHQSTVVQFKKFKQVYTDKVLKDLMDISKFMNEHEVHENSPIYRAISIDVKKLLSELTAFHGNLKELMTKRDWGKEVRVTATFNMVITTFQRNKKMIQRHYEEFQKREIDRRANQLHAQAMADGFVDESMDNMDLDPYDKPVPGYRGQGRRGQGGGRGRGGYRQRGGQRGGRRR